MTVQRDGKWANGETWAVCSAFKWDSCRALPRELVKWTSHSPITIFCVLKLISVSGFLVCKQVQVWPPFVIASTNDTNKWTDQSRHESAQTVTAEIAWFWSPEICNCSTPSAPPPHITHTNVTSLLGTKLSLWWKCNAIINTHLLDGHWPIAVVSEAN